MASLLVDSKAEMDKRIKHFGLDAHAATFEEKGVTTLSGRKNGRGRDGHRSVTGQED